MNPSKQASAVAMDEDRVQDYLGGCQNYGPFSGTLNIRCRIKIGTSKYGPYDYLSTPPYNAYITPIQIHTHISPG